MCVQQPPFGECGINGLCAGNNTCVCQGEAWVQNTEFHSFHLQDSSLSFTLPCDTNETAITLLYGLIFALANVILLLYSRVIETWKKLKRLWSMILWGLILLILSACRLFSRQNILFGQNILFTMSVSCCFALRSVSGYLWCQEYILYLIKKFPILDTVSRRRLQRVNKINAIIVLQGILIVVEGSSLAFIPFHARSGGVFQAFVAHFVLNSFFSIFASTYLLRVLYYDIKVLYPEKFVVGLNNEEKINLRRQLPRIKANERRITSLSAVCVVFMFPVFVWDFTFTYMKYFFPILLIIFQLESLITLREKIRRIMNQRKKFAKIVELEDLLS